MGKFVITGGNKLRGKLHPQGAKNEALQVICASLLTSEKVRIQNIPEIRDVLNLIDLLKKIGVRVNRESPHTYTFQADQINIDYFYEPEFQEWGTLLRGSILIAGPILARHGKALIPYPGGDKIGRRRLDTHFNGFEKLGAKIQHKQKEGLYSLESEKLKGCYMLLEEASVTGTANLLMASVLASGETIIYNAACEPYIQQLCMMLNNMGARISGVGSNLLKIKGVNSLSGCGHNILPDMIEIGSFIGLAALSSSELTIENVSWESLGQIPDIFRNLGIILEKQSDNIFIPEQDSYEIKTYIDGSIMTIADAPWPGLTPDLISILLVVATQASGSVLIHQKMFESRLFFVDKLIDMGARIILCDPHRATVIGLNRQQRLRATIMNSPDIRAGVALLIAAISAEGTSVIHNIEQIDRGYQNIDLRLNNIGAKIIRYP